MQSGVRILVDVVVHDFYFRVLLARRRFISQSAANTNMSGVSEDGIVIEMTGHVG